jgi:hypothetical protein
MGLIRFSALGKSFIYLRPEKQPASVDAQRTALEMHVTARLTPLLVARHIRYIWAPSCLAGGSAPWLLSNNLQDGLPPIGPAQQKNAKTHLKADSHPKLYWVVNPRDPQGLTTVKMRWHEGGPKTTPAD